MFQTLQVSLKERARFERIHKVKQFRPLPQEGVRKEDRESVESCKVHAVQIPARRREKIFNGRSHAVTRCFFGDRVDELGIQSFLHGRGHAGYEPPLHVRMPVSRRDSLWVVVEIAPRIRPPGVVEEDGREGFRGTSVSCNRLQFMKDGVPVVVTVDEDGIEAFQSRQDIQTGITMESQNRRVGSCEGFHVAGRERIDAIEQCPMLFTERDQAAGGVSAPGADLHDVPRLQQFQARADDAVPEAVHGLGGGLEELDYTRGMRIAFITSEFVTEERNFDGGLSNYVYRAALTLRELGHEPVVLVASEHDALIMKNSIRVYRVGTWGPYHCLVRPTLVRFLNRLSLGFFHMAIDLLWQSFCLNRKLKELHALRPFGIVHYAQLGGTAFFRPRTVPCVARVSGASRRAHELGGYGETDWEFRQQEVLESVGLKRVDAICCPSTMVSGLIRCQTKRDVRLIETPFVLDVRELDPSVYVSRLVGKKYLLFFGTICLIKGIATIAEIIHDVLEKHPDLFFVFVGKEMPETQGGYSMSTMRLKADEHAHRVVHLDRMSHEQLYPVVQHAHGVVLPSRVDNFPNACIEAMAFGRVVIGTRGNGFEQLIEDGVSGYLVDVDGPASLRAGIERLLSLSDGRRHGMGAQAAKRIELLRPQAVGRELVTFYDDAVRACQDKKSLTSEDRPTLTERLVAMLERERWRYRRGTFSFGSNWKSFNRTVRESAVMRATHDILGWLKPEDIQGKDVVDIGCGSGLHSLCFHRLGVANVLSFDADPRSVEATKKLWRKEGCPVNWRIAQASVLDEVTMHDIGTFDFVYAWGVLHHTGNIWGAVDRACRLVKPGGKLWLAIYGKGPTYEEDLALKKRYNAASWWGKKCMELHWIYLMMRLHQRNDGSAFSWKRMRGMNMYHDIVDWLGGLPYEVADPEEIKFFCYNRNLRLLRMDDRQANVYYLFSSVRRFIEENAAMSSAVTSMCSDASPALPIARVT